MSEQILPTRKPKKKRRFLRFILVMLILLAALWCWNQYLKYENEINIRLKFGIETLHSSVDRDGDGIDDYADIVQEARRYIRTNPDYVSDYFGGGYPPEGQGVCTDVLWRALKAAGYDFKAMVDKDIGRHPGEYPLPNGTPDSNIDFRRVVNLQVFFKRFCTQLTIDTSNPADWQPGDIVVYEGHVALVSDKRNEDGLPWIIHHTGHGAFEEDGLLSRPLLEHYRWELNEAGLALLAEVDADAAAKS